MVIVWRLRGNIIRSAVCWVVWHNVDSQQSHRRLQHTAGTACHRTARCSGPAIALHQSPAAVVFHSGDWLCLAVSRCPGESRRCRTERAAHSLLGPSSVWSYTFITDCGSRPDCSCSSMGTNDRTSPAWQHDGYVWRCVDNNIHQRRFVTERWRLSWRRRFKFAFSVDRAAVSERRRRRYSWSAARRAATCSAPFYMMRDATTIALQCPTLHCIVYN